ncbi:MAG: hypothetical protein LBF51_01370, partial [Zoogloeaceae bacterium]|nr:hypothetical protein [Zoogloeaceae bacterium]
MTGVACRESVTARGSMHDHGRGGQVMSMLNRGDNHVEIKVNIDHAPGSRAVVDNPPKPAWARRVKIVIAGIIARHRAKSSPMKPRRRPICRAIGPAPLAVAMMAAALAFVPANEARAQPDSTVQNNRITVEGGATAEFSSPGRHDGHIITKPAGAPEDLGKNPDADSETKRWQELAVEAMRAGEHAKADGYIAKAAEAARQRADHIRSWMLEAENALAEAGSATIAARIGELRAKAIAVYERIDSQYSGDDSPDIREGVAKALVNKG